MRSADSDTQGAARPRSRSRASQRMSRIEALDSVRTASTPPTGIV